MELVRSHINLSTFGMHECWQVTAAAASKSWAIPQRRLIEDIIPRVRHWTVICGDYRDLPEDLRGCFFIDPPYANAAGAKYQYSVDDYHALREWILQRNGHVIVCEQQGAEWLPFRLLTRRRPGWASAYWEWVRYEMIYERWPQWQLSGCLDDG